MLHAFLKLRQKAGEWGGKERESTPPRGPGYTTLTSGNQLGLPARGKNMILPFQLNAVVRLFPVWHVQT